MRLHVRAMITVATLALLGLGFSASAAELNWPSFRGPYGDGHVRAHGDNTPVGLPLTWSETANVVWKTEIPPYGWSTPVTEGNDIWLTTATETGNDFFAICVALDTGKVRYNEKLFHSDNPEPLGNGVNCYASPSSVIEPGRVWVHFGSYGTACIDTKTLKTIWSRNDLPCRHYRGPGSSPILWGDLLILTFDGADQQYVTALDKKTGKTVWRTDRSTKFTDLDEQGNVTREGDFRKGFATPLIVDNGGKPQLVSIGSMSAFGYDPATGKELWNLPQPGHTPAPSPVFDKGMTFIINGRGGAVIMSAVKVDGQGDVTDSKVVWKNSDEILPHEPSPIIVDGLMYLMTNNGTLSCLEAATGTVVWSERLGGNYVTSPIYADGRLYFCSTQGKCYVTGVGREYKLLATNDLDGSFMASPAVAGKSLILRTKTHLYRIEESATAKP